MDKIRFLWLVLFPICLATIVIIVSFGSYAYAPEPLVLIAVPSFFLYLIFIGIEELLQPKKKERN